MSKCTPLPGRTGVGFAALFAIVAWGAGCASDQVPVQQRPSCAPAEIYDSRVGKCLRPATQEEARELATRGDLEKLRDAGDYVALTQVTFRVPADRTAFSSLLSRAQPDSVTDVEFFFPNISGGFSVPARLTGTPTSTASLISAATKLVAARFAAQQQTALSTLSVEFSNAFALTQERYLEVDLRAKPSALLGAWAADPNIAYIAVVTNTVNK